MANPYETGLDKNAANYLPLTPITFLERTAKVFPDQLAIIHGARRVSYRDVWRRCVSS